MSKASEYVGSVEDDPDGRYARVCQSGDNITRRTTTNY